MVGLLAAVLLLRILHWLSHLVILQALCMARKGWTLAFEQQKSLSGNGACVEFASTWPSVKGGQCMGVLIAVYIQCRLLQLLHLASSGLQLSVRLVLCRKKPRRLLPVLLFDCSSSCAAHSTCCSVLLKEIALMRVAGDTHAVRLHVQQLSTIMFLIWRIPTGYHCSQHSSTPCLLKVRYNLSYAFRSSGSIIRLVV